MTLKHYLTYEVKKPELIELYIALKEEAGAQKKQLEEIPQLQQKAEEAQKRANYYDELYHDTLRNSGALADTVNQQRETMEQAAEKHAKALQTADAYIALLEREVAAIGAPLPFDDLSRCEAEWEKVYPSHACGITFAVSPEVTDEQ